MLDLKETINDIPASWERHPDPESVIASYTLYDEHKPIGMAQIIQHPNHVYELAYLYIDESYRHHQYGTILLQYILYHTPYHTLWITTIIPQWFEAQGFVYQELPSFVDHQSLECQQCHPSACRAMSFSKDPHLVPTSSMTISPILELSFESMLCDYSPINHAIWSISENVHWLKIEGYWFILAFPFAHDRYAAMLPYEHIPRPIFDQFCELLKTHHIQVIRGFSNLMQQRFGCMEPSRCIVDRNNADYLYLTSDFAELPGKRFEKKRNRLRKFLKQHPIYSITAYQSSEANEVIAFFDQMLHQTLHVPYISSVAILREGLLLNHLSGYILRVKEQIVAALFYSVLNRQTLLVHFECTNPQYDGASVLINHHFALEHQAQYAFINREQDLGIEGLRRSKLSYRPFALLQKYQYHLAPPWYSSSLA